MRYARDSKVVLSEDNTSDPKFINFQAKEEVSDLTSLLDSANRTKSYPIGTHVIDMGQIAEGRWLYIKPTDKDVSISLDGGAQMLFRSGKASEMWVTFTSLSMILTEATRVNLAIAGE